MSLCASPPPPPGAWLFGAPRRAERGEGKRGCIEGGGTGVGR